MALRTPFELCLPLLPDHSAPGRAGSRTVRADADPRSTELLLSGALREPEAIDGLANLLSLGLNGGTLGPDGERVGVELLSLRVKPAAVRAGGGLCCCLMSVSLMGSRALAAETCDDW